MIEVTLDKIAAETNQILNYTFETHPNILAGETISSVTSLVFAPSGELTTSSQAINAAGTIVQAKHSGGTAGKIYTATCTVATSSGASIIVRGSIRVV